MPVLPQAMWEKEGGVPTQKFLELGITKRDKCGKAIGKEHWHDAVKPEVIEAAHSMKQERIFGHYPACGPHPAYSTTSQVSKSREKELYSPVNYRACPVTPGRFPRPVSTTLSPAEAIAQAAEINPPYAVDPSVLGADKKSIECQIKETPRLEVWATEHLGDLPAWDPNVKRIKNIHDSMPPPEPKKLNKADIRAATEPRPATPTDMGGLFDQISKKKLVRAPIPTHLCSEPQPNLHRNLAYREKKRTGMQHSKNHFRTKSMPAKKHQETVHKIDLGQQDSMPAPHTSREMPAPDTTRKDAARQRSQTENGRVCDSDWRAKSREIGWRMEVHGDPYCLKAPTQNVRGKYNVKLKEPLVTRETNQMHFNQPSTFFLNTVPMAPLSYTISPNFISEQITKNRQKAQKSKPKPLPEDRLIELAFVY